MGADQDPQVGDVIAFWLEGATEEKRDAHHRAERWAHVLSWQIERLYASRREAMDSQKQVRASGFYPDEARWPFFAMEADAHPGGSEAPAIEEAWRVGVVTQMVSGRAWRAGRSCLRCGAGPLGGGCL